MTDARIYTKLGDDGSTGLLFGGRTGKDDPLIDAVGTIDEAVAALGLARAGGLDPEIAEEVLRIQRELFVLGADLVANPHARDRLIEGVSLVTPAMTTRLEGVVDTLVAQRPLRPVFLVPGANTASAALDLARTIVRRAERRLVQCHRTGDGRRPANPQTLVYVNRLSDLLYVLARRAAGVDDEPISHDEPAPSGPAETGQT